MKAFEKWFSEYLEKLNDDEFSRAMAVQIKSLYEFIWKEALGWVLSHKEAFCAQDLDITMWELVEKELNE